MTVLLLAVVPSHASRPYFRSAGSRWTVCVEDVGGKSYDWKQNHADMQCKLRCQNLQA